MYAISRLQAPSGVWYWKVNFSRRRKSYQQRFYESKHGGSAKSLEAAKAWRDSQLAQAEALTMVEFCQRKRSNNNSGVPGVHLLKSAAQPVGCWQAKLKVSAAGKYKSRNYSVLAHGYHEAYEMAVAARLEMLAGIEDRPYLYDSLAKKLAPKVAG